MLGADVLDVTQVCDGVEAVRGDTTAEIVKQKKDPEGREQHQDEIAGDPVAHARAPADQTRHDRNGEPEESLTVVVSECITRPFRP